jgi:hypothetical protein
MQDNVGLCVQGGHVHCICFTDLCNLQCACFKFLECIVPMLVNYSSHMADPCRENSMAALREAQWVVSKAQQLLGQRLQTVEGRI